MPLIGESDIIDTASEPWMAGQAWYAAAADLAGEWLGNGDGKRCLVIGSPVPEAKRLQAAGWRTLYVDVRRPPADAGPYLVADATALPLPGRYLDAVRWTCVLCHAGLGRYGDVIKANGDVAMLAEVARVLKVGGLAAVMAGPAVEGIPLSVVYGNVHRIYKPADVATMAESVGLQVLDSVLCLSDEWVGAPEIDELAGDVEYCYLSVLLRKPA